MKALYARKYYNRDPETLPHKNYVKGEEEQVKIEEAEDLFEIVQEDPELS